jgi:cytochrome c biogenesis protein CcmG/thiol:disulfide interchange protein DsbE
MARQLRSPITVTILILIGITLFVWKSMGIQAKASAPIVNRPVPEFTLKSLQNDSVALKDVYRQHKVTLLNFWATWCPPCRDEIPDLNRIYNAYRSKSVEILGVNLQESPGVLRKFVKANNMRFPVLMDTDGKIVQLYQIYYIPTTFIIDSKGKIRQIVQGGTTYEVLSKAIDSFLQEE